MLRENDVKDFYKVIESLPILCKQYPFIDCICCGSLDIDHLEIDKFNESVNEWSVLLEIETKYNKLLQCVSNNNIRGVDITISGIFKCHDLFSTYIYKNFHHFHSNINGNISNSTNNKV